MNSPARCRSESRSRSSAIMCGSNPIVPILRQYSVYSCSVPWTIFFMRSPDHRVRTGPEDLPLALLVDVHLRDRMLLALLVDRHLEVLEGEPLLLPVGLLEGDDAFHEVLLRRRHDRLDDRAGDDVLPLHGLDRLFCFGVELDLDPLVFAVQLIEHVPAEGLDRFLVPTVRLFEARGRREVLVQVDAEDLLPRLSVRARDVDGFVEPAR